MRVMLAGAAGQLGRELQNTRPPGIDLVALDRGKLDITSREQVLDLAAEICPQMIVNAAAYTAVDGAETRPDLAVQVNAEGPGYLARAAQVQGAQLIHISTDFVFDGGTDTPYKPQAEARPLGVYGHSKLAGERRVHEILPSAVILRTSWVYSQYGNNFVKTLLQRLAERDEVQVVNDEVGAPTWARGLAEAIWACTGRSELRGIWHWTDAGQCSRYEFASAIAGAAMDAGLLQRAATVEPIPGSDYPTPAQRPPFSVLDCTATEAELNLRRQPWREQLRKMLEGMGTPS